MLTSAPRLAKELNLHVDAVRSTLGLLADGNTVPFIARYRKEATGELDEVQIRAIQDRHGYLTELEARRATILESIADQDKLTPALEKQIREADNKTALEDIYLPYRPTRRTRATIARERGLGPLAEYIQSLPAVGNPRKDAQAYIDPENGVDDADAALQGARDIIAEGIAERTELRQRLRDTLQQHGKLTSKRSRKSKEPRTKFESYYDHRELLRSVPSHRYLALRRGESEGVLKLSLEIDDERALADLARRLHLRGGPYSDQIKSALGDAYKRLLRPSLDTELHSEQKRIADQEAVKVFADNLEALLLAGPLGSRAVVAIDPGLRTGCKCVALDATGRYLGTRTIYPVRDESRARSDLESFLAQHRPQAVAVGNGTGGRETEALARQISGDAIVVSVNESGASIYSASDIAREEFPELDLTIRGAISIGRRLQDPLAELVKLDPQSIGVGQYQHDVDQGLLASQLDDVVESCVNRVGVEVNTASAALLTHVSGIGPKLARSIVAHREATGPFSSRVALKKVKGLGPKAFEQAAGFLRLRESSNPLDASAVHPERYALVKRMAKDLGASLPALLASADKVATIQVERYVGDGVGEPTLRDILAELNRPGRDPREEFVPPAFRDDIQTLDDLYDGLELEGVVTNVTNFGAFVDVGVHQDGLVHISQLADRYVSDPHTVVSVGERLKVRVLSVDLERKRIALTAK